MPSLHRAYVGRAVTRRGGVFAGAVALWLGAAGGAAAEEACRMQHITDLPLMKRDGGYYTKVTINGQDVVLNIDSGAEKSLLRASVASRLHLPGSSFHSNTLEGVGGLQGAGQAVASNVQLGDVSARRLTFWTVQEFDEPSDVDGVLGMDFLSKLDIDFDLWGGHLGLYKALEACKQPSTALQGALYSVDLLDEPDEVLTLVPIVEVSINGTAFRAEVDAGADNTIMYRTSAARAGLAAGQAVAKGKVHGFGPDRVDVTVRVSAPVQIGEVTFQHLPVLVLDQARTGSVDMLLGRDFMDRVHVWISHSSHTMIMQYPPGPTSTHPK